MNDDELYWRRQLAEATAHWRGRYIVDVHEDGYLVSAVIDGPPSGYTAASSEIIADAFARLGADSHMRKRAALDWPWEENIR